MYDDTRLIPNRCCFEYNSESEVLPPQLSTTEIFTNPVILPNYRKNTLTQSRVPLPKQENLYLIEGTLTQQYLPQRWYNK